MAETKVIKELIENSPNSVVVDAWAKLHNKLNQFNRPVCAISGGSDSDVMLHMCAALDDKKKIKYVFFDTGLEFSATKEHIKNLEKQYGVTINRHRAEQPVPVCVKRYGVPFLNKRASDYIERLQRYDFQWEDLPFDVLYERYPKCKAALRWWCNEFGEDSRFNIAENTWLKEFLVANPPTFKISNKCCVYAKKATAKSCMESWGGDLNIIGVRKAEGGARASAYKNCFSPERDQHPAEFRPILWFSNKDKEAFVNAYGIKHSDCYEVWGLQRTGCSGCPFARDIDAELDAVRKYEPKLYKALMNVFGESYEYTKKYRAFQREMSEAQNRIAITGGNTYTQMTWEEYEKEIQ